MWNIEIQVARLFGMMLLFFLDSSLIYLFHVEHLGKFKGAFMMKLL
jgi:hypothetical protein